MEVGDIIYYEQMEAVPSLKLSAMIQPGKILKITKTRIYIQYNARFGGNSDYYKDVKKWVKKGDPRLHLGENNDKT